MILAAGAETFQPDFITFAFDMWSYQKLFKVFVDRGVPREQIHCSVISLVWLCSQTYFDEPNIFLCARHSFLEMGFAILGPSNEQEINLVRIVSLLPEEKLLNHLLVDAFLLVTAIWDLIPHTNQEEDYNTDLSDPNYKSLSWFLIGYFAGYF